MQHACHDPTGRVNRGAISRSRCALSLGAHAKPQAGSVWRTLWRRDLTVKIVGTWTGRDQHLAVKTWITRSCPLPCDVRKLEIGRRRVGKEWRCGWGA